MPDSWTDRLCDYLDGELSPTQERELDEHLETCAACARTLDELRAVATRAQGLEDRPPARNLWPGIAARISGAGARAPVVREIVARPRRRAVTFSVPQLLAAGLALLMVGAGATWLVGMNGAGPGSAGGVVRVAAPAAPAILAAGGDYDAAVAELELLLEEYRSELDPRTIQAVERSLRVIDRAITEAREALAVDPADAYLSAHLAQTMQRKIELLRRAVRIAES
jgi:hypothetical protein